MTLRPVDDGQSVHKKQNLILIAAIVLFSLAVFAFFIYENSGLTYETSEYNLAAVAVDLEPGVVLEQAIPCDVANINSFSIKYGTYERYNAGVIHVALYEDDTIVQSWDTDASILADNQYEQYELDNLLSLKQEHSYYITIESEFDGDNMVAVWGSEADDSFQLCLEVSSSSSILNPNIIMAFTAMIVASTLLSVSVMIVSSGNDDEKKKERGSILKISLSVICLVVFSISLFRYTRELFEKFLPERCTVYGFIVVVFVYVMASLCLFWVKGTEKEIFTPLFTIALFLVYSLRAPGDMFSSFLWAEDGVILIQDGMNKGFTSLFTVTSGTHWFAPRAVSYISYRICLMFNNISALPAIQGTICKLIAACSVGYFLHNRFEWIVKQKALRFVICAIVVCAIPYYSSDVVVCDTSLPFVMNFAAFLIGLDVFCKDEARPVTWLETLFLAVLCISTAAAPIPAAVACLAFVRWIIPVIKEKGIKANTLIPEVIKVLLVGVCALIQVIGIFSSSRSDVEMDLLNRVLICLKHFVFWPYYYSFNEWSVFIVALLGCVALALLAKMPWKIMAYSSLYSFAFLLYCSMVAKTEYIEFVLFREATGGSRYILISYMIAAFILAIEICLMWNRKGIVCTVASILLVVMSFMSTLTYSVDVLGDEYTDAYSCSAGVFDSNGSELLNIPIGPWYPWSVTIPWERSNYIETDSNEINFYTEVLGESAIASYAVDESQSFVPVAGEASLADGSSFRCIFICLGNDSYLAPIDLFDCGNLASDNADYDFVFFVNDSYLQYNSLAFVGITEDDQIYTWEINGVLPD